MSPPSLPLPIPPLLSQLRRRWWDASYKDEVRGAPEKIALPACLCVRECVQCPALRGMRVGQVRQAMRDADSTQLHDICHGFLAELCSEDGTTAAMQVLHFASREEDLSRRLLGLDSFRAALEAAAGNAQRRAAQPCTATNCRSVLQLLHTRCTLRPVHEFECVTGGSIRIAENRAFGGQSTCKHDGTLKTGGVIWDAAHCLVDLMHRLGPDAFRGKSVLELGAGCGYVGIVAARMGGVVTVTDRVDHIQHLRQNVELNGLEHSMRVAELEWSEPMAADIPANFDWILASDCVYEEDSHRPLAETLLRFTRPDGATVVLISQETRSDKHSSFFSRGAPLCRCLPPANSIHCPCPQIPLHSDQHYDISTTEAEWHLQRRPAKTSSPVCRAFGGFDR
jgi:protein-L-isoaspartate O-methyltransferase